MRFASKSKQIIDPDTLACSGLSPAAFALREDDNGGLSVTWIEYFGSFGPQEIALAANAHRLAQLSKSLPPSGVFAWAKVTKIKQAALGFRKSLRVVHDPIDGNEAHAEIRHFTDEDLDLLDHFASDVFVEYDTFANIQAAAT